MLSSKSNQLININNMTHIEFLIFIPLILQVIPCLPPSVRKTMFKSISNLATGLYSGASDIYEYISTKESKILDQLSKSSPEKNHVDISTKENQIQVLKLLEVNHTYQFHQNEELQELSGLDAGNFLRFSSNIIDFL